MLIGYARVSTQHQDTALQREAFKRFGVRKVIEEKRSGGGTRPLLEDMLDKLRPGDIVAVYKIDRLARSLVDLLRILQRITEAGASFRSLTEPLETETPIGRMMIQLLGAVAEFERAVIRERCAAGRVAAVHRGVQFGAKPKFSRKQVLELLDRGYRKCDVADYFGVARNTVRRALSGVRICDGGVGEHRRSSGR
jgi:DNA invertase Pin-like site-specific DNA recombinase